MTAVGISEVLVSLFWLIAFVAFIAGTAGTIVHFVRVVHAPIWVAVVVGVLMVVLPYLTLVVYWLVAGVVWVSRRQSSNRVLARPSDDDQPNVI